MGELTAEQVRFRLHYDPETGIFTWRNPSRKSPMKPGDRAGAIRKNGYVLVCVDRQYVFAHTLAWVYMTGAWPPDEIDHKDTDPGNNRWTNLRPATSTQNKGNANLRSDNTSGLKGAFFIKNRDRWLSQMRQNGKSVYLGYFHTAEEAHAAYAVAARGYFGEYARTG